MGAERNRPRLSALLKGRKVHEENHDETYFELFYDLIIVVVFIKLGYIRYEVTSFGFFTTFAIFLNFWRFGLPCAHCHRAATAPPPDRHRL